MADTISYDFDIMERSVLDAITHVHQMIDGKLIVRGGGTIEMQLATHLLDQQCDEPQKQKIMQTFGESLKIIPEQLKTKHKRLDNFWESASIKQSVLENAKKTICHILNLYSENMRKNVTPDKTISSSSTYYTAPTSPQRPQAFQAFQPWVYLFGASFYAVLILAFAIYFKSYFEKTYPVFYEQLNTNITFVATFGSCITLVLSLIVTLGKALHASWPKKLKFWSKT